MRDRFTLTSPGDVVVEFFELPDVPVIEPRRNIAPTQAVPVNRDLFEELKGRLGAIPTTTQRDLERQRTP